MKKYLSFVICLLLLFSFSISSYAQDPFAKIITAIGTNKATLTLSMQNNITDDLIIPSNIDIRFNQSGSLNISSGKKVTMRVPEAGLYQIFYGEGTVEFTGGKEVYPEWWGAKADGIVLSVSALNKALASVVSCISATIRLQAGIYVCEDQIKLWDGSHMIGAGAFQTTLLRMGGSGHFIVMVSGQRAGGLLLEDFFVNGDNYGTDLDGINLGAENPGVTDYSLTSLINRVNISYCTGYGMDIYFGMAWVTNIQVGLCKRGFRATGTALYGYGFSIAGNEYEDVVIEAHQSVIFGLETEGRDTSDQPTISIIKVDANEVSLHHVTTSHTAQRLAAIEVDGTSGRGYDFVATQIYNGGGVTAPQYTIYDTKASVNIANTGVAGEGVPYYSNHSLPSVVQSTEAEVYSKAQKFFSRTGLVSVPTATPTTLYSLLSGETGLFLAYSEANPTIRSLCLVGRTLTNVFLTAINEVSIALSLSTYDIQATHTLGSTLTDVRYTFIKM
uniref:Uncharacterized protein n=1 Tax=viral metagenome TaxID=1070528 RepID=A0A6M3X887_9ZZZZ